MITIADQILLAQFVTLDSRLTNVVISEDSVIIETIEDYLTRIDLNCRQIGMKVNIMYPTGVYNINTFLTKLQNSEFKSTYYTFSPSTLDQDFNKIDLYGPYESIEAAYLIPENIRTKGLTIGIELQGKIIEY